MKTVREPLILADTVPDWLKALGITGPAEVKTYAAAGQALVLMALRPRLQLVRVAGGPDEAGARRDGVLRREHPGVRGLRCKRAPGHIGVFFYVWVGLFSLSIVAQFWSYANDIYTKDAGNRLFPIIGVGMTAGSPVGAWIADRMFDAHLQPHVMLYLAAALLLATTGFYVAINRGRSGSRQAAVAGAPIGGKGAFSLVFASRYIRLIVVLLILLNIVNTVGEYILSHLVVAHAAEAVRREPGLRQERLHRRLLRQLLLLGERHRRRCCRRSSRRASSSASACRASCSRCPSSPSAPTASWRSAPPSPSCAGRRRPRTRPTTR